jgi:hypothetical protein
MDRGRRREYIRTAVKHWKTASLPRMYVSVSDEPYFDHICNLNYVRPSSGMEASIIVEGFKLILSLYGVIYESFIGYGDSNVLNKN